MKKLLKFIKSLTLFDKLVIIIALCIIVIFLYIFFRKQTLLNITVKVTDSDIQYSDWQNQIGTRTWFSELFYTGMQEKDGLGRINSEVTNIWSYDTLPSRKALYLNLKIKVVQSKSSGQYTYKGNPVLIGYPIKLFMDKVYVQGLITNIEGVKDPRKHITLIVNTKSVDENPVYSETSGISDYIANAIKEGEEVKDNNGKTILKITKKVIEDAKKVVTTANGSVILQNQPLRKDVYLTLQVNATKVGDRYYIFDDTPILIGSIIPINTPTISLSPQVINIMAE